MSDLLEHILNNDYVEANRLFESRISEIMEKKLYEAKRSIDLTEIVKSTGKKDKDGNLIYTGQNTKKDWAKYRKENPRLSFYGTPENPKARKPAEKKEKTQSGAITKHGLAVRRKKGYLQAHPALKSLEFIKKVTQYHKTGKVNEETEYQRKLAAAAKEREAAAAGHAQGDTADEKSWNQKAGKVKSSHMDMSKLSAAGKRTPPAMDVKKLAPHGQRSPAKPLKKDTSKRNLDSYKKSMERLNTLRSRGYDPARADKKAAALRKAYAGVRAKRDVKAYGSVVGGFAKNLVQGMSEDTE